MLGLVLLASMAALARADYPAYCAKDMNANRVQPLKATNVQLIQVQVVVRHGARTPWSGSQCWDGYNEEWNCNIHEIQRPELKSDKEPLIVSREFEKIYTKGDNILAGTCNLGQMIDEGYHQQTQNGAHLREAYVGPRGLFQSTDGLDLTNTSDFYFESSDIPRTINSGMIIIDQIFPRGVNDSSKAAVPWHTSDYSRAIVTPNPNVCPKLSWIDAAWRKSDEYVAWTNSPANQQLERDLQKVVSHYSHDTLFDCFMTAKCTDRSLPSGIDDDLFARTTSRESSFQIQQYLYNQSSYARVGMAAYINRIRQRAISATKQQAPRFVLSAAHDTTIMPVLGALGGASWLTEWVPYASHMIFEVYANQTDHYVRILYQGKPLSVPGCSSELCPFSAFLALTEFAADSSICALPTSSNSDPVAAPTTSGTSGIAVHDGRFVLVASETTWTWLYVIGGVLAGTALGYFAGSRGTAERQGYSTLPDRA
ncbi:hypothetical protein LEN26_010443 [Aphanomyces euteiches]|nr:hypothetical protein LEN26_010443 [Aphanomyces euteiches]